MNRRLVAMDIVLLTFPALAEFLALVNPLRSSFFYSLRRPVAPWVLAADFAIYALTLIIYPALMFVLVYMLAKRMRAGKKATLVSLAVFAFLAHVTLPFVRAIILTSPALQEPGTLWELIWPSLPFEALDGFVYEFLIALGALALPRLIHEWKTSEESM